jgi:hypothetical protein
VLKITQKSREENGVRSGNLTPVNRLETLTGEDGNFDRCGQEGPP